MITISRNAAQKWFRAGRVPAKYKDTISVIMRREDAERWLKKLEDGTQKQTEGILYDNSGGFCCLGLEQSCNWGGKVEADVYLDDCGTKQLQPTDMPTVAYLKETGKRYVNCFNKFDNDPYIWSERMHISGMNDSGWPFKDIAKALRKHMAVYD